jgi:hypothetical protein
MGETHYVMKVVSSRVPVSGKYHHMKILEEDLVDWEPLLMRFISVAELPDDRRLAVGAFLEDWFRTNAAAGRADCDIRFWNVDADELTASCEHLTRAALRRLTRALDRRFPEIDYVRIGVTFDGVPSGFDFRWVAFSEPIVEIDGKSHPLGPFAISTYHVSFGQFTEFMAQSGYEPDCDKAECSGYLESHMRLNWGKNPKTPVFGVTHKDAVAFCDWANVRLPTEPELHLFFFTRARAGKQPDWGGECWTTTRTADGNYVLRDGPYPPSLDMPIDRFRSSLPANHYDYPFPGFRVAKSLEAR